jgi:hypothetical protein
VPASCDLTRLFACLPAVFWVHATAAAAAADSVQHSTSQLCACARGASHVDTDMVVDMVVATFKRLQTCCMCTYIRWKYHIHRHTSNTDLAWCRGNLMSLDARPVYLCLVPRRCFAAAAHCADRCMQATSHCCCCCCCCFLCCRWRACQLPCRRHPNGNTDSACSKLLSNIHI